MTSSEDALERRLETFKRRLDAKISEFSRQGALHGAERQAAADMKLRRYWLANAKRSGRRPRNEFEADLEILELTFERWLARVDNVTDLHGSSTPSRRENTRP